MAAYTSKASGGWDQEGASTWNEAGHPGAGDTVTIQNTHAITLESATQCTTLTIDAGGSLDTTETDYDLTVSGVTAIAGTLTLNDSTVSLGTGLDDAWAITVSDGGDLEEGGADVISGGVKFDNGSTVNMTTGTHTVNGYGTYSTVYAMYVDNGCSFDANGGLVHFDDIPAANVYWKTGGNSFHDVEVDYDAVELTLISNVLTVTGTLTVLTGKLNTNGSTDLALTVTGLTTVTGTLTLNDSTVVLAAVTVSDGGTLEVDGADVSCSGNFTVGGGSSGLVSFLDAGDLDLDGATFTINAGATFGTAATTYTVDINSDMAASAGTFIAPAAGGDLIFRTGNTWHTPTTFTHSGGEWTVIGSGTATIANHSTQFYDLEVANFATLAIGNFNLTTANQFKVGGGASGTVTNGAVTITIGENLWVAGGASVFSADTAFDLSIAGTCMGDGTINLPNGDGSCVFTGTLWAAETIVHNSGTLVFTGGNQSITNDNTFFNFDKHVDSAATLTVTAEKTLTIEGELDLYGASGELLTVTSSVGDTAFDLVLTGTKGTIQYLDVSDSDASGSDGDVKPIDPSNSTDSGGTTDWFPETTQPDMQIIIIS